ncbi:MAG TPA: hypothetical protein DCZ75_10650 [Geobacter sp.]|nr:hypothetical protein [Geobacter sp.]
MARDIFIKLAQAAREQSEEGDFPCWLLADILEIAGASERYADKTELIELLLSQVQEYDSHAGAGCFGASVGPGTIEATLRKIMQR